jgi:hypothetical protein
MGAANGNKRVTMSEQTRSVPYVVPLKMRAGGKQVWLMSWQERMAEFCVRLAVLLIVAGILILVPEPQTIDVLRFKNAGVAFVTVILIGVLLFDTFFYDHFQT